MENLWEINRKVMTPEGPGVIWGSWEFEDKTIGRYVWVPSYEPKPGQSKLKTRPFHLEELTHATKL